jgi:hypothetical protein
MSCRSKSKLSLSKRNFNYSLWYNIFLSSGPFPEPLVNHQFLYKSESEAPIRTTTPAYELSDLDILTLLHRTIHQITFAYIFQKFAT